MSKWFWMLTGLCLTSFSVHAEIFKCPKPNGTVVYQTPTGQAPKGSTIVVYVGSANG